MEVYQSRYFLVIPVRAASSDGSAVKNSEGDEIIRLLDD